MPKTLRGSFEQALRPLPSVVKRVQACRLRPQMPKTLRGSFDQALRPLPSVVKASNAKEEGVGGTRALAHSIMFYIYIYIRSISSWSYPPISSCSHPLFCVSFCSPPVGNLHLRPSGSHVSTEEAIQRPGCKDGWQ